MDLQSRIRWEDYTAATEEMFDRTNIPEAPWWVVMYCYSIYTAILQAGMPPSRVTCFSYATDVLKKYC